MACFIDYSPYLQPGEFGAIAGVSGALLGNTQTVTLFVQERFQNFDQPAAYAGATALVAVAVLALIVSRFLRPQGEPS